jgi:hypothetical protein
MLPRNHLPQIERQARSRLAQLLHQKPFLIGSLVSMPRVCGKSGCKCTRGELHPGLYLASRVGTKRRMIHVPHAMEEKIRQWVLTYQELWQLMEQVSQSYLDRFQSEKQQLRRKTS